MKEWATGLRAAWRLTRDRRELEALRVRNEADARTQRELRESLQRNPDAIRDRDYTLALWKHYEDIAVHFNDLIMRWRLQAIGGLATLITVAGFVVGDATTLTTRYRAMGILAGALAVVWAGVAVIDLYYYRRLLRGAVNSLIALEDRTPDVRLSTEIELVAGKSASWTPWVFYLAGLAPLLWIVWWAWRNLHGWTTIGPNQGS